MRKDRRRSEEGDIRGKGDERQKHKTPIAKSCVYPSQPFSGRKKLAIYLCFAGHLQTQRVRRERTNSQGKCVTRAMHLMEPIISVLRCYAVGGRNVSCCHFVTMLLRALIPANASVMRMHNAAMQTYDNIGLYDDTIMRNVRCINCQLLVNRTWLKQTITVTKSLLKRNEQTNRNTRNFKK